MLPDSDISGASIYSLDLPNNLQQTGGIYYVDMSGVDVSGNLLDISGVLSTNELDANIITFTMNVPVDPAFYPGLEFTIFFKNPPIDRVSVSPPLLTIGIGSFDETPGAPLPYIVSPPVPWLIAPNIVPSITFKSDGENFNVVSSGPAGWLGLPALVVLLSATTVD